MISQLGELCGSIRVLGSFPAILPLKDPEI
jgi:hypothetical protein